MNRFLASLACAAALAGCGEQQSAKPAAVKAADASAAAQVAGDAKAGQKLAEAECRGCHGLEGGSVAPGVPHLAAQDERYLLASLKAYKDGKRSHAALKVITERLGEADLRNVAAYYASLPRAASRRRRAWRAPRPTKRARRARSPARSAMARTATVRRPAFPASPASKRATSSRRCRNTCAASASLHRCTQ